jgi:hypothetical protein
MILGIDATVDYAFKRVFGRCRLHQQQLHEGEDYVELKPTISISFLNDVLFPGIPSYHHCFGLLEKTHHFPLTGDIHLSAQLLGRAPTPVEQLRALSLDDLTRLEDDLQSLVLKPR